MYFYSQRINLIRLSYLYPTYAKETKPIFYYPNSWTAILRELEKQWFLYHLFGEAFRERGISFYVWFRPPTYTMR